MSAYRFTLQVIILLLCSASAVAQLSAHNTHHHGIDSNRLHNYPWKKTYSIKNKLINRIHPPHGYKRIPLVQGSFADWLRHLPLKDGHPDVYLYNGTKKANQQAQHAVVDIDVGDRDLQQCADAIMRLRGEYFYATHQQARIKFHFTNGFLCDFIKWSEGYRPRVEGNTVTWRKSVLPGGIYPSFRKYMETIFAYCGSQSLSEELTSKDILDIYPGDVFIHGGFPGHAVIVLDVAQHEHTGEKIFLLAQSYMPAQDIHILKNPNHRKLSPWYSTVTGLMNDELRTPEWTFKVTELKTFNDAEEEKLADD